MVLVSFICGIASVTNLHFIFVDDPDGIQLAMVAACLVCATSSRITLCGPTLSCYAYVRTLQFVTADCIADASSP